MRMLRSRWTVVALVPAFFLTGFAVVAALADDADEPSAAASVVTPGSTEAPAEADVATEAEGGGEAGGTDASASAGAEGAATTTEEGGGQATRRTAPPPGRIAVDYGRWGEWFAIESAEIVPDFGAATVTGELRYLGGADCPIGDVVLAGRFFDADGRAVGRGRWDSTWATGEGAEFPQREPLPLELNGTVIAEPASASIRFVRADCL